jgi:hypothetical protein
MGGKNPCGAGTPGFPVPDTAPEEPGGRLYPQALFSSSSGNFAWPYRNNVAGYCQFFTKNLNRPGVAAAFHGWTQAMLHMDTTKGKRPLPVPQGSQSRQHCR